MEIKGIDVSYHQGAIDWEKVRKDGVKFAILRDGYGKFLDQKDKRFDSNYSGAKAAGIPVGAYHYSYAVDTESAKMEAAACLNFIKGKRFEYPIAYDIEDDKMKDLSREKLTQIALTFCKEMEKAGYYVCIYSSRSWLETKLDTDKLKDIDIWLARWASAPGYGGQFGMWQYSSSGNVDGINGNVDMDIAYKDYPSIIKSRGLNGYKVTDEGEEIHELKAGERIDLQNAPLYISSSAKRKARNVNGVYYVYDGKEINGRYRITKLRSRVEKKPTAINVTGWINKEDAV